MLHSEQRLGHQSNSKDHAVEAILFQRLKSAFMKPLSMTFVKRKPEIPLVSTWPHITLPDAMHIGGGLCFPLCISSLAKRCRLLPSCARCDDESRESRWRRIVEGDCWRQLHPKALNQRIAQFHSTCSMDSASNFDHLGSAMKTCMSCK